MTEEEEYEEILDETEDDLDTVQDIQDYQAEDYENRAIPNQGGRSEGLYDWFWKIVRLNKPSRVVRVGNLSGEEIGRHDVSVRSALDLHLLGKTFHHPVFANYYASQARITSVTSMAKKGWFMDLTISQKKVRERNRSGSISSGDVNPKKEGWRLFKKKT